MYITTYTVPNLYPPNTGYTYRHHPYKIPDRPLSFNKTTPVYHTRNRDTHLYNFNQHTTINHMCNRSIYILKHQTNPPFKTDKSTTLSFLRNRGTHIQNCTYTNPTPPPKRSTINFNKTTRWHTVPTPAPKRSAINFNKTKR